MKCTNCENEIDQEDLLYGQDQIEYPCGPYCNSCFDHLLERLG